jgi:PRTRC genetic system protein F
MGLPRITAGIPTELIHTTSAKNPAKIALALLDAGLLTDIDLVDDKRHPVSLIENSFKRWFEYIAAPLSIFDLKLDMTDSVENWDSGFTDDEARELCKLSSDVSTVAFGVHFGQWDRFYLKERIEAIELVAPGLGKTAMERMERVLHSSMFAVTPSFIEDAARYNYWGGADDEGEYLAECCGDDEEREEMMSGMITKADVDALMPNLETKVLSNEEIIPFTASDDTLVASVAANLLAMDSDEGYKRPHHTDQVTQDGSTYTERGVWIQWQQDNLTDQIADDWYNYVSECNCLTMNVFWMCELTSEKIAACMKNIERYITRLIWCEQLLKLVGTLL